MTAPDLSSLLLRVEGRELTRGKGRDLTGLVFGRLTARRPVGRAKKGTVLWTCNCVCGNERTVESQNLLSGGTISCGCYHRERLVKRSTVHGGAKKAGHEPEYAVWATMKARCSNPGSAHYRNYGGRGISVCSRWQDSYAAFVADMGPRPTNAHSIERVDNNGNYEPGNCRWATKQEQGENRRTSRAVLREDGLQFPTIRAAARSVSADPGTVADAIKSGRRAKGFTWVFAEPKNG